ncbi:MAG: CPBP family intramembrane metalloprotease [Chloroflexi bacterium]|jgi:membrane protease YdiL (CAAX protease family)|nr:CPBP family intramembrane metalloprotease [Chloroflexota bacterium]
MIKRIFWNADEHRVRALWRLIAQMVIFAIFVSCAGGVPGAIIAVRQYDQPGSVDPAQIEAAFTSSPYFILFTGLGGLVAIIISVGVATRFLDRRPLRDFGFHFDGAWWRDLGFGLGLGGALMLGIFLVEWLAGWLTITDTFYIAPSFEMSFVGSLLIYVGGYLGVGIYEEVLSRGYQLLNIAEGLQSLLTSRGAIIAAWVLTSAFFGLAHAGNPNATWISTFNIMLAGLFLGLGYILTGELAIPIGLHITWNFFQGVVFGFPVSGNAPGATFIAIEQGGPATWTGGPFGPEAGLIGIVAMLVGSAATWLWIRQMRASTALDTSLAEYEGPQEASPSDQPAEVA